MGLIKPKNKKEFNIKAFGIIFLIIGGCMVIFSIYLLIFGGRAEGSFKDITAVKSKYINHYEYTVDGKKYEYTERVSKDKGGREGDTVTVYYLKQNPDTTYDKNALAIGIIMVLIGGFSVYAGIGKDNKQFSAHI